MTLQEFKKKARKIPDAPGVYFFLGKNKKVLYIGKATSLRDRMRSYFATDLHETRGPLITQMIERARSLDWRQTGSVLEALILEANLIKNYKPEANTDLKDDKSWNYVVITKEDFPRVLLVRGRELASQNSQKERDLSRSRNPSFRRDKREAPAQGTFVSPKYTFGPFPHGLQLKEALKLVRKIFPYRDSCSPGQGRRCFNAQLGLCPGVCSGEISRAEYRKIIRRIVLLFKGKKSELERSLVRDIKTLAKEERFEEAQVLSRQLFSLRHIQDVSLIKEEYRLPAGKAGSLAPAGRTYRIEAYDVAHLRGSAAVGVMTVIEDGQAQKSEYRKFKIKSAKPGDDPGALKEILSRRLGHDEWPLPRLIAVDGAAAQINAAESVLKEYGVGIPVVGVVKDEKHRPRTIRGLNREKYKEKRMELEREILLANAEAHRFAISYHRKKSRRGLTAQ